MKSVEPYLSIGLKSKREGFKIWIFEEFSGWMKEKLGCAFRVKTLESPWLVSKVSG
jgi:hypothetical protein